MQSASISQVARSSIGDGLLVEEDEAIKRTQSLGEPTRRARLAPFWAVTRLRGT